MKHEIKAFAFEFEAKEDGDAMTLQGYGSTFGGEPDSYGDVIAKGAFGDSLKARTPKMLYQHDPRRICGVWDEAKEDSKGLFCESAPNRDPGENRAIALKTPRKAV
jgi:HK97 family phage prohead protease